MPLTPYVLRTERLCLRCYQPADAELRREALAESRDALLPWFDWAAAEPRPLAAHLAEVRRMRGMFDLNQDRIYGVFDAAERQLLGEIAVLVRAGPGARELGYWLHPQYAGRGLATEAVAAVVHALFMREGLERVEIHCSVANDPSAAVARRLGFTHEGTLRQRRPARGGEPEDNHVFSLLQREYAQSPAARAAPPKAYGFDGTVLP
jgi:RimJ/RimL family protein N-acetyltransferase